MLPTLPPTPMSETEMRRRPRGLWKGRETPKHGLTFDSDHDERSAKRQRSEETSDDDSDVAGYYIVEYSPEPSGSICGGNCSDNCCSDDMETPSTPETETRLEDWDDLKDLFARAAEQYENDDVNQALSLLRSVINESARFLMLYEDPSVLIAEPRKKSPPRTMISPSVPKKKCKCKESPTAFHALLGTALFLFGNLLAQDPTLALPDEPSAPTYWFAALDVFESGECLPSRVSGRGCEAQEDWRMAVIWGRTLLCVADAALTLQHLTPPIAPEPKWSPPPSSPFAAIAARRPPASRRTDLASAAPHDLFVVAVDHFSRGIFHMPHALCEAAAGAVPVPFNRASELFTIAREVLALAERLPDPVDRMRWAAWAEGVLQQIQVQTPVVARARGRCWLVVGTSRVEDIEAMAEARGWGDSPAEGGEDSSVLDSEEAEEAREGLERAVEFFEHAGVEGQDDAPPADAEELRMFLVEALVTLANFTKEEGKREDLYRRAQLLGGDALEGMDIDQS